MYLAVQSKLDKNLTGVRHFASKYSLTLNLLKQKLKETSSGKQVSPQSFLFPYLTRLNRISGKCYCEIILLWFLQVDEQFLEFRCRKGWAKYWLVDMHTTAEKNLKKDHSLNKKGWSECYLISLYCSLCLKRLFSIFFIPPHHSPTINYRLYFAAERRYVDGFQWLQRQSNVRQLETNFSPISCHNLSA